MPLELQQPDAAEKRQCVHACRSRQLSKFYALRRMLERPREENLPAQSPRGLSHPAQPIGDQLQGLSALLQQHSGLWRPQPFVELDLPWQKDHPELMSWLDGLTEEQLVDPQRRWLQAGPPWLILLAQQLEQASGLPWLAQAATLDLGAAAMRRVPGRKVQQMAGFCATVLPYIRSSADEIVDWCAGKSHLGRTLARLSGKDLLALERDPELVSKGQQECDHLGLRTRFHCADVLHPAIAEWLGPNQWVVALHACGDLHGALLRVAAQRRVRGVAVAPCCYNLIADAEGRALSHLGRSARLDLTATDLDLVHREPVVVNSTDWAKTQQELAWRLGFDLLQREFCKAAAYRAMPSFPRTWLRLPYTDFCRQFAALDGMVLPGSLDVQPWETLGWQRLAQVRRRELLRGLFRSALETWLVLDRAQLLVEAGFTVQAGRFCDRSATPRNAMILASLAPQS